MKRESCTSDTERRLKVEEEDEEINGVKGVCGASVEGMGSRAQVAVFIPESDLLSLEGEIKERWDWENSCLEGD